MSSGYSFEMQLMKVLEHEEENARSCSAFKNIQWCQKISEERMLIFNFSIKPC